MSESADRSPYEEAVDAVESFEESYEINDPADYNVVVGIEDYESILEQADDYATIGPKIQGYTVALDQYVDDGSVQILPQSIDELGSEDVIQQNPPLYLIEEYLDSALVEDIGYYDETKGREVIQVSTRVPFEIIRDVYRLDAEEVESEEEVYGVIASPSDRVPVVASDGLIADVKERFDVVLEDGEWIATRDYDETTLKRIKFGFEVSNSQPEDMPEDIIQDQRDRMRRSLDIDVCETVCSEEETPVGYYEDVMVDQEPEPPGLAMSEEDILDDEMTYETEREFHQLGTRVTSYGGIYLGTDPFEA